MKNLYLIRHGQTLFNEVKKIQGWCDSPLTELGKKQALQAKEILSSISFDHYYSSTSERCCDTLELIIGEQYYERCKGLKEVNFGLLEGESEYLLPRAFEDYDIVIPKYQGESPQEVIKRFSETCIEFMNKEDHETVLACTHGGILIYALLTWVGAEKVMPILKTGLPNCAILHFTYDEGIFDFVGFVKKD